MLSSMADRCQNEAKLLNVMTALMHEMCPVRRGHGTPDRTRDGRVPATSWRFTKPSSFSLTDAVSLPSSMYSQRPNATPAWSRCGPTQRLGAALARLARNACRRRHKRPRSSSSLRNASPATPARRTAPGPDARSRRRTLPASVIVRGLSEAGGGGRDRGGNRIAKMCSYCTYVAWLMRCSESNKQYIVIIVSYRIVGLT
jgi:hypothetical protein